MADDVDLHPPGADQALLTAVEAVEAGRWQPMRDLLADEVDWDEKAFRLNALASATDPNVAQAWTTAEPRNPDALSLLARVCVQWAWPASSSPPWLRDPVPAGSERLLHQAEECASAATRLAPGDPTASALLILLAVARKEPKEEVWRRLGNTLDVHRWNVEAHEYALMYLCRRWNGSHKQMHAFAYDTAAAAPLGSRLHNLPLEAHCEWETAVFETEGRLASRIANWRLERRWKSNALRADVDRTMIKWFRVARPAGARHSRSLHVLAYVLVQADRFTEAAEVFGAIGRHVHPYPWNRIRPADPESVFRAAREHAREHARDQLKD
jgi:hypothetical protein